MRLPTHPAAGSSSRSRRQIIKRFRQAGFEVMVASDVLEALALLQERPGLLVLLRIEPMPGAEEHQPLTLPQPVAEPIPGERHSTSGWLLPSTSRES